MAFTVNKKAFCVLEFAKTESVVTVQRRFRIMFHTEPPTDKTIREWYMNSSRVAACALRNEKLKNNGDRASWSNVLQLPRCLDLFSIEGWNFAFYLVQRVSVKRHLLCINHPPARHSYLDKETHLWYIGLPRIYSVSALRIYRIYVKEVITQSERACLSELIDVRKSLIM